MGPSCHRRSAAAGRAAPCPWARPLLPASSAGAPRGERGRPWEERRGHPGLPRGPAMACVGGGAAGNAASAAGEEGWAGAWTWLWRGAGSALGEVQKSSRA